MFVFSVMFNVWPSYIFRIWRFVVVVVVVLVFIIKRGSCLSSYLPYFLYSITPSFWILHIHKYTYRNVLFFTVYKYLLNIQGVLFLIMPARRVIFLELEGVYILGVYHF